MKDMKTKVLPLSLLLLSVVSCTDMGTVEDRARSDLSCSSVSISNEGDRQYRASGCGQVALYSCRGGYDDPFPFCELVASYQEPEWPSGVERCSQGSSTAAGMAESIGRRDFLGITETQCSYSELTACLVEDRGTLLTYDVQGCGQQATVLCQYTTSYPGYSCWRSSGISYP
jgi:hypothetical protein